VNSSKLHVLQYRPCGEFIEMNPDGGDRLTVVGTGRTDLVISAIHNFPFGACAIRETSPTRMRVGSNRFVFGGRYTNVSSAESQSVP
jgi:hypothetical protein